MAKIQLILQLKFDVFVADRALNDCEKSVFKIFAINYWSKLCLCVSKL